ncbi:hypothetical protein GJ744_010534 [Endocarpon pusillum]|uniref:Methyltransferase domain-containing protein n=1 Tax=Endocarpon pusillum TaxID=364733 RepID=A0A8H7AQ08_9EURO|nr:hypothetical protein GJ744_010534 [Endocarpon pusillum]
MATQSESQIKHHPDHWSFTSNHHHHVERTVHPVIVELIKWATQTLPPNSSSAVLDDGCGLGTVTAEVKKSFPDLSVLAIDSAAGMLEAVNRKAKKHDWKNVTTRLLDGGNLHGVSSNTITHAFACTYIDLAHNATACIKELQRVIAPGGILGMNTWADPIHPSISTPWTKACQQVYPEFKAPLVTSPKWSTADQIKDNLEKAGFKDVQTKQVITHWRWASPEEMTDWFFNGGNPVCGRWHEALVEEVGGKLEGMRERFHEELVKEYREEGGQLLNEELVNLTIARK